MIKQKSEEKSNKERDEKLLELFHEFYHYYLKVHGDRKQRYQPVSAFITFQTVIDRETLLDIYKEKTCWEKICQKDNFDQDYLFKGQNLHFQPCEV